MKKAWEKNQRHMLYTSKSDFVRWTDINCKTSYYEMMYFILRNDESKIFMLKTSKPGFVWQKAVFAGSTKQVLNRGPQFPQTTLEPLSLSKILDLWCFMFI